MLGVGRWAFSEFLTSMVWLLSTTLSIETKSPAIAISLQRENKPEHA